MTAKSVRVALIGDFNPAVPAHVAIPKALELAATTIGAQVESIWCDSSSVAAWNAKEFSGFDAFWCVPNSPYKSMDGGLRAIRFARENGVPFLGTCGGFQYALIEYARNVLGIPEADHAESNPAARVPVISLLACELVEKSGEIFLKPGSQIAAIYGAEKATEQYHCRYGLNPKFEQRLRESDLQVSGWDAENATRAVELRGHPFFIATLFQSERNALQGRVPPLARALLKACR